MFGFGRKKEEEMPVAAAPGLPIEQVMALRQRGMNNDQIIPELERQGYNSSQIFDALNQVNIGGGNIQSPPDLGMPQPDFHSNRHTLVNSG